VNAGIEPAVIDRISRHARPVTFRKVERHKRDNTRPRSTPEAVWGMESDFGESPPLAHAISAVELQAGFALLPTA
jgi:hypothetical protein